MPELLPCPWCGSAENLRVTWQPVGDRKVWDMQCDNCKIETDRCAPDPDVLAVFWNARAKQLDAIGKFSSAEHVRVAARQLQWPSFEEWLAAVRDAGDGKLVIPRNMQNVLRIAYEGSKQLHRRLVHSGRA